MTPDSTSKAFRSIGCARTTQTTAGARVPGVPPAALVARRATSCQRSHSKCLNTDSVITAEHHTSRSVATRYP